MLFVEYYDKFHNGYDVKHHSFLVFFVILSVSCRNLVVYYLNKPLKLCKRKSDLLFQILQPVFAIASVTHYVEIFNWQIPHDHICRRSLKIQSCSWKLYFRTGRSSPYNFPCVSLVSSKPKQRSLKES